MDEREIKKYCIRVNADHPNGNGSFVKILFAEEKGDDRIQQACHNRQNDLTPQVGSFPTDIQNAGHSRAYHAKHHQPGQYIFKTDIKMRFSFHSNVIIQFSPAYCKKKHQRQLTLMF